MRERELAVLIYSTPHAHLPEDWDLALADRYQVDPHAVRTQWSLKAL